MLLDISATELDQYLYWRKSEDTDDKILIGSLLGLFKPSIKMSLGSMFHDIIEAPEKYLKGIADARGDYPDYYYEHSGRQFPASAVDSVIGKIDYTFPFEVKLRKEIVVDGQRMILTCQCDQWTGLEVQEFKSTWATIDIEKYMKSYQWRCYCWLFEAQAVNYTIVQMTDGVAGIKHVETHELTQYPYLGMVEDIKDKLVGLVDFIRHYNLIEPIMRRKMERRNK
jgi:hypothetical protein